MIGVLRPGLLTTIQDDGRWGHQRFGVPVAGPMDRRSHRLANLLVGNRPSCATLEVTLVGPQLEFADETLFAVTGAEFELELDDLPAAMDTVHTAHPGQRLVFGSRRRGARAYVGVAGGFDVPVVLGSRATHVASGIGGVEGRALKEGDALEVGGEQTEGVRAGHTRHPAVPVASGGARVRVILGPHEDRFGAHAVATFEGSRYVVSVNSDRMGYRLSGPALEQVAGAELLSSAVETGTIQVPRSGEPIILMADHQTVGGYPRIGTVITADLPIVAQLSPLDWIEFEVCNHEQALTALIDQEQSLVGTAS